MNSVEQIYKEYKKEWKKQSVFKRQPLIKKKQFIKLVEQETKRDVHVGVKTYQFQCLCHTSSQGQTPFVSNNLNLREAENEQEQKDLAFVIEEILKRRIKGVTDKRGDRMAPLFPKLLYYVCEGLNLKPSDPYYYLTELAAQCMAVSMQPDILSEKKNREAKSGQIIPCMGAARGDEIVSIRIGEKEYLNISIKEAFEKINALPEFDKKINYSEFNCYNGVKGSYKINFPNGKTFESTTKNLGRQLMDFKRLFGDFKFEISKINADESDNRLEAYTWFKKIDRPDVLILSKGKWENVWAITKNDENSILKMFEISYDKNEEIKTLHITEDHPLHTQRGRVRADELKIGDEIYDSKTFESYKICGIKITDDKSETYDFEVSNDMFDLSGIVSHNCRSFLAPVWIEKEYPRDTKFYWQEIGNSNVQYKNAPGKNFDYSKGFGTYSTIPDNIAKEVAINFKGNTGWVKSFDKDTITIIEPKVYGRFNGGVVTCNIPHAALTARKNVNEKYNLTVADYDNEYIDEYKEEFFKVLDERLELCHKGLLSRWELSVKKIKAKNSPLLWQYGALARMSEEDSVGDWILSHQPEYTSFSLGFIGLYETCRAIINDTNTSLKGQQFSVNVLEYMNKTMSKWKEEDKLGYSIYATPEENLTQVAAMSLKKDFGLVPYVTDHDYVTNGYHVNPAEKISAWDKLKIEGQYLQLCTGGSVSYIEVPDMKKNTEALETVIQYIYDNIMYAEINTKIDTCWNCNYQGELKMIKTDGGNFKFKCPKCGCEDPDKQLVTRRICGYLGSVNAGNTNKGRLADIYDRVLHLDNK